MKRHIVSFMKWIFYNALLLCMVSSCISGETENQTEESIVNDSASFTLYDDYNAEIEHLYDSDLVFRIRGMFCSKHDLSSFEKLRDTALISRFYKTMYDAMIEETDIVYREYSKFIKSLYTIDFDLDGRSDIFFTGQTQGESVMTKIFMQKGKAFIQVFSDYQYLSDIRFNNGRLTSFTLNNPGCCDDDQVVIQEFEVQYKDALPKFILKTTYGYSTHIEKVKMLFDNPLEFSVINKRTFLVTETIVADNILSAEKLEEESQFMALYTIGATGIALGGKKNEFGEWLFVRMDASPYLISTTSYSRFIDHPTCIFGWLRLQDIRWNTDQN